MMLLTIIDGNDLWEWLWEDRNDDNNDYDHSEEIGAVRESVRLSGQGNRRPRDDVGRLVNPQTTGSIFIFYYYKKFKVCLFSRF